MEVHNNNVNRGHNSPDVQRWAFHLGGITQMTSFLARTTTLVAVSLFLTGAPAVALEQGDWLVRGRIINVHPNDDSGTVSTAATGPIAGSGVTADGGFTLDIDITYMFTRHIGAELLLDLSSEHDVAPDGTLGATLATATGFTGGDLLTSRVLPPSLLLQYHFLPASKIRPYLGAGVNFTLFFDEDTTSAANAAGFSSVEMDESVGFALQAGADFELNKDWFMNVDVKYIDISTTASFKHTTLGRTKVDVDIDPFVFGIGVGRRF
jgi:outer membrane protein